ncbi:hypothetical protein IE077_001041 [Cardiosporidium cionae]|uniref:Uncharacterized protein n=1 Tax=Cardiosporidium cionae TaxID=476202 RepID=A0ABQ7JDM3_9APIC|nr:hypothetical protein IE077_001041 [Cardiosporidium cionae]|eukprot:KAF8822099.1 hypothetical protein IE077_001041 [Cardiosporidium cionae]
MASVGPPALFQDPNSILFIGFNQDGSCLAAGTNQGFIIYSVMPFAKLYEEKCGAVSIVEMLYTSNLIAIVGSSDGCTTSSRMVMMWNATERRCLTTLSFNSAVHGIKMNPKCVVVLMESEVRIYDLVTLTFLHLINREADYSGNPSVCSLCCSPKRGYLAIPCSK